MEKCCLLVSGRADLRVPPQPQEAGATFTRDPSLQPGRERNRTRAARSKPLLEARQGLAREGGARTKGPRHPRAAQWIPLVLVSSLQKQENAKKSVPEEEAYSPPRLKKGGPD